MDDKPVALTYEVAVRTLCEFTAKRGDLDMRFTPSPSAAEGMAGHRLIASRRAASFQTELTLAGDYGPLHVRGRADGYDPEGNRLEEFKTYRGALADMPDNHRALHWAQLRIYGCLMCRQKGRSSITLALIYLDVASEQETVLEAECTAGDLEANFVAHCQQFLHWAESEAAHRSARDQGLRALVFPFAQAHPGQKMLARSVYRNIRSGAGGALLAQAPTGIGKTIGTLFPALKALASGPLDKVFYLVPKTSGRQLALDALQRLHSGGAGALAPRAGALAPRAGALAPRAGALAPRAGALTLRVVELVARGKACEYPGMPCDGAVCPLARGFYDRLAAARAAAIAAGWLDQDAIRQVARQHRVCPYYLAQELARWSDVVVGDYNYYFDRAGMLFGWTQTQQWRICLLVDEAHNLVERARAMYTATLEREMFQRVLLESTSSVVHSAVLLLLRAWDELVASQEEDYRAYEELPGPLLMALEQLISAMSEQLLPAARRQQLARPTDESLQEAFFAALAFSRLAAEFDTSTLFEIRRTASTRTASTGVASALCLRNVVPGRFLAQRFAAAHTSVLFSATLAPFEFFRDILGLPRSAEHVEVGSPFRAEQLTVRLVRSISTRFRHRQRSLAPMAGLLARQYAERPGNYLVFLSSFNYLDRLVVQVNDRHPQIPTWKQHPAMNESDREAFLARFTPLGRGVGFAVLGGAFAEGIDLPGSRLIGAFVATLGLPQVNPVNAEIQRRMDALFGAGYEYTYLYPGIQKVVQAAGRVIRTPSDQGVLYLIDDRYADSKVRKLLPRWWSMQP
jgi:DNA excision repair protein ERCC-2